MDKLEDAISQGDSKGLEALQRLWAPHCHKLLLPKSKKTLLMLAARHGRVLCTKFLLLTSASGDVGINDQTRNGFTALHYAAYHGNADVVWLLLEAGADTNVRDNEGEDASDAAIAGFHAELALSMRNSRFFPEPPAEPTIEENLFDFRRDFFQELNQKMESLVEKPSSNNDVLPQPVPDQNILATHEPTTASMTRIDAEKMIFEVVSVMDGGDIALLHSIFYCLASENRKAAAAATAAGVNISEASSLLAGSSQQNLMVQHGQWDVAEDLTVGRSRGNDACLPDLSVSKQHAVLSYFHNVGLVVRDCGSKHGTFVDGVQVKHGQSPMVVEGTQLRFGRICCEVKRLRQAAVLTSGFQPNAELRKLQAEALRKQQLLQIEKDKKLQPRATSNESSSSSHRNGGQKRKLSTSCNVHDATEAAAAGTKEAVQPISSSTEWREEGSKLMRKMGWDGSAALGSYTSEQPPPLADAPVNAVKRKDRAGLGTESAVLGTVESLCTSVKSEDVLKDEAKERQRSMMIARFKELDKKHSTGFFEG